MSQAILAGILAIAVLSIGVPQGVEVKPVRAISSVKGIDLYTEYCEQCHGKEGRGDGYAAKALKKPPADLTTLAARNGGRFPGERVIRYIHGRDRPGGRVKFVPELRRTVVMTAEGPMDMPPYGVIFDNLWSSWQGQNMIRLRNLTKHVEGLQVQ